MQKDLNKSLEIRQKVGNWSDISRGGNNRAVCKQHRNTPVSTWARWAPSTVTCSGSTVRTRAQHLVPGLALGPCAGQDGHSCLAGDVRGLGKGNYCSCLLLTAAKEPVLRCSGRLCCKEQCPKTIYHWAVPRTRLMSPAGPALRSVSGTARAGCVQLPVWFWSCATCDISSSYASEARVCLG